MDEVQAFDLSCEDNGLLTSSSDGFLHNHFSEHKEKNTSFGLLEDVEAITLGDIPDNFQQSELLPQPSESLEPERTRKNGKCNLRKSLAWDSAFFTSAGFLEPEELSSMLEGVDKGGKKILPVIQEDDIHRSIDSLSTLESDSLTLESLEADLFHDIRASIQKSSKAFSAANLSNQAGSAEKSVQTNQSSRKVGLASQNKVNSKLTSKWPSNNTQGSRKMTKESSKCQQVKQPVARGGESASSLPKLPNALGKAGPISTATTKRASMGANRVKVEKDNSKSSAAAAREAPSSRTPGLGGSRSSVPRPTQSLKFSSSGSSTATKKEPTTSCSSLDSSGSVSSKNVGKSPSNSMKRLPDSKANKPPSSGPKIASRNKSQQGSSHLSAYLKSATKFSSISPASSISEWSSESLLSTSTTKQRFSSVMASVDSNSPWKGVSVDSDSPHAENSHYQSNGQFSVEYETQATGLQSQCVNEVVMGTGASSCAASAKLSGLRVPSPKIGFFDEVKSVVHTPKGGMQSHSGISFRKSGPGSSIPSGGPSNTKSRNINSNTLQTTSTRPTSLIPLRDPPSNTSIKVSSATRAVRNCPGLSPKVKNVKSKTGGKSRPKTEEQGALAPDRAKYDQDPCLKSKMSSEIKEIFQSKNLEITPVDGDGRNASCNSSSSCAVGMTISSHEVDNNAPYGQNHFKNGVCSLSNTDGEFDSQNDGVIGHMETVKLSDEMDKELIKIFVSQSDVNCPDDNHFSELACPKEVHVCGQIGESLNILSSPTQLSLYTVNSEITAEKRIPFAVKNSFSDRDGVFDYSKGLMPELVEKTNTLPLLESAQKENN